ERHYPAASDRLVARVETKAGGAELYVESRAHGARRRTTVDASFVASAEYQKLSSLAETFRSFEAPFRIDEGKASDEEVKTEQRIDDAVHWLSERGGKGASWQRYKGLGEMNPEQLWETTMDPSRRVILQVNMSKTENENEMFETLMGDQVEPRRDFIERNALDVSRLDI
ncbi:MAG: DNA gyrase subunit B, partial [Deltaproteobacteria bacterium]|nr:DNA gyrase subunit B [Deltaproteobacteria bacterium]